MQKPSLAIGQTLSHYKILEEIGRGGMGVVYRALDRKLNREVALKVLAPELVEREVRKARFILEARAAAALVHPHIATVFEIDDANGTTFIAMELIEGERLRESLSRGRLSWSRALVLATGVVEGLDRAHQKGIIHRDLKPENVMVMRDGHGKIIDFGLAKLVEPLPIPEDSEVETVDRVDTGAGVVVGTVSYMSPEQARGENVDARSDIFSFGVLLHEVLSGENPFERKSVADTLSAILHDAPRPLVAAMLDTQEESVSRIQRVLDKCLAKDREQRYQTAKDLLLDLRWIQRESDPAASPSVPSAPVSSGARRFAVAAAVLVPALVAIAVAVAITERLRARNVPVPGLSNPVQVTFALGAEGYPTWSPEGGRLAYHLRPTTDDASDIWVTQIGVGQPVNLTEAYVGIDQFPSWSPDGRWLSFFSERNGSAYFEMPALGGAPRELLDPKSGDVFFAPRRLQWSSDGKRLAAIVQEKIGLEHVVVTSTETGEARQWALHGISGYSSLDLAWSPDERYFAYVNAWHPQSQVGQLLVLDSEDGDAVEVTDGRTNVWSPFWSGDGRFLFYASNRGGPMDLWRQPMQNGNPAGDAQAVTTGLGVTSASMSGDGTKLAYSKGRLVSNVWRIPILPDRPASWTDARQITFDEAHIEDFDLSPDGTRLAVSSDRSGNPDLWIVDVEGGEMQQLTTDPTPDWAPKWSPDGTELAFYAYRSGKREVWLQSLGGRAARQVTTSEAQNMWPDWSPDGRQIAFQSTSEKREVWIVASSGGTPRRLTEQPTDTFQPSWSPDGKFIAFGSTQSGRSNIWRASIDGTDPRQLSDAPGQRPRWSSDAKWVYFVSSRARVRNVWAVSSEGGREHPLTDLSGRPGRLIETLAVDGNYLYFIWREEQGDIWVADLDYE